MPAQKLTQPPRPAALHATLQKLSAEIRANPRLQTGLLVVLAVTLFWLLLSLDDQRKASLAGFDALRRENASMSTQLGSPTQQIQLQSRLEKTQTQIETALWHFPTPVIAQTEFGDWIRTSLRDSGITESIITQPSFRNLGEKNAGIPNPAALQPACTGDMCNLIEIRAGVRFRIDPATLVKALAALEGSEHLIRIDQITLGAQNRIVELSLVTHAKLTGQVAEKPNERPQTAAASTANAVAPAISASMPEILKKVEIKW